MTPAPTSFEIRPARPGDATAARSLLRDAFVGTPYLPRALEMLEEALEEALGGTSREALAIVAAGAGGAVVGLAAYGETAGAVGAGRLHLIAVTASTRRRGVGARLVHAVARDLGESGARFIIAELPDDSRLAPGRELLLRCGFGEEARVPDFYADGVALAFFRRALGA
ncbi:MAG: GNAT family N-acetyltransferase [Gemmatimonadaceae bacterium]